MPAAVMVMVGGPEGAGLGAGTGAGVATGGVGAVGAVDGEPPEQAAAPINTMKEQATRITASRSMPEGALRTRACLF